MHRLRKLPFGIPKPISYASLRTLHNQTQLQDAGPMASILKTRAVVRFRGPDTVKFLQGLVTNDIRKFEDSPGDKGSNLATPNVPMISTSPVYAAMLTAQGRFLYDMFLYKPSPPGEMLDDSGSGPRGKKNQIELFADVDCSILDELLETLKKYRLRSKVEIENVAEDFSCWQRYGGKLSVKSPSEEPDAASLGWGGAVDKSGISAAHGSSCGWQWFKDPRLECLGFRGIFPSNSQPPLVDADKQTQEENYLLWRLEQGVAEGSLEIPKGEAMPLEYNLEGLNAISFDKGCYVGQELVARTHHRGVIRKRLLPVKFVDAHGHEVEQKVAPSSEVTNVETGKKAGVIHTALGSRGMGVLRLEEAFKTSAGRSLAVKGQEDVKVQAIRPDWWPPEWSVEHQEKTTASA